MSMPTNTDALKSNLGEAGSHLASAAAAAGEAIKGAASAAGDELRLGKANVKSELADSALSGIAAAEAGGGAARAHGAARVAQGRGLVGSPPGRGGASGGGAAGGGAAREQVDALMDKGRDLIDSAADLIRERPLASFGVAFAAGWIIAKLARSGGDK